MKKTAKFIAVALVLALALSMGGALAEGYMVTTATVNMRSDPGVGFGILRTLPRGATVLADRSARDENGVLWYYVHYSGQTGWVISTYLRDSSSGSDSSSDSTGTLYTTATVNMRTGAGTNYARVRTVAKGTAFAVTASSRDTNGVTWYYGSANGNVGWIISTYLSGTAPSGGTTPSGTGTVTTTGQVNLRTGAGLAYASLGTVARGVTLTATSSAKDARGVIWYLVTYNGKTGWISSRYTSTAGGSSTPSVGGTVTTTGQVNLRAGAGLTYASLGTVAKGVTLSFNATATDSRGVIWYRVTYNGKTGWISGRYTR